MLPANLNHFTTQSQHQSVPVLTQKKLRLLEESSVLSITEKVELALIFMHKKWVGEVDIGLENKDAYIHELERLELPWSTESYDGDYKCDWIQVGANRAVLEYLKDRRDQLSELEAGVLYGFPLSHVLGFIGVLREKTRPPINVATYMLGGVYSDEFQDEEAAFFGQVWNELEATSPVLAKQAQDRLTSYQPYIRHFRSCHSDAPRCSGRSGMYTYRHVAHR